MDVEADSTFTSFARNPEPNSNHVKFFRKFVTNREGKNGVYKDFIMIISPGQDKSEVHRPVQDKDKQEYPTQWMQYEKGVEQRQTGVPLENLPGIPAGMARACNALYIYTIEQMASLSDAGCQEVGMGALELRNRAKEHLTKVSSKEAGMIADIEKLKSDNDALRARLDELTATTTVSAHAPTPKKAHARKTPVRPAA